MFKHIRQVFIVFHWWRDQIDWLISFKDGWWRAKAGKYRKAHICCGSKVSFNLATWGGYRLAAAFWVAPFCPFWEGFAIGHLLSSPETIIIQINNHGESVQTRPPFIVAKSHTNPWKTRGNALDFFFTLQFTCNCTEKISNTKESASRSVNAILLDNPKPWGMGVPFNWWTCASKAFWPLRWGRKVSLWNQVRLPPSWKILLFNCWLKPLGMLPWAPFGFRSLVITVSISKVPKL